MNPEILIIGATGFIGSNLLKTFEEKQTPVRVLARTPSKVVISSDTTEVLYGDLDKKETLVDKLEAIKTIYYLAHAMNEANNDFVSQELKQAQNLAEFLTEEHKLIYLGGIIPDEKLSDHLQARANVGKTLRESKATIVEFRASIIIGKGSASFEIVRAIINKLPLIITAKWSQSLCQPIALIDVLNYLISAHKMTFEHKEQVFNIAGPDLIAYHELLTGYAKYKGLYRPTLHIKNFPKEAALKVLHFISSEYYTVGERLLESIEHETVLHDHLAQETFAIEPKTLEESFDLLDDDSISQADMANFFQSNLAKELPQYLVGDSIQIFIPLANKFFDKFIEEKLPLIKDFISLTEDKIADGEVNFRIPKVGEFRLNYNKKNSGVLLVVKPDFFFQSLGFTFLKKLLT